MSYTNRNLSDKQMTDKQTRLWAPALAAALLALAACTDGGENPGNAGGGVSGSARGPYFIDASTDGGTEYIMQAESLTAADLDVRQNIMELPSRSYTWVCRGHEAIGMSYNQQFAGLGYALRWTADTTTLADLGEFRVETRFTNFGFFDEWFVTSVAGQSVAGDTSRHYSTFCFWRLAPGGVTLDKTETIPTAALAGNGQIATFSSIVDLGDGTFLTSMVKSDLRVAEAQGQSVGRVLHPDSCWVVRMDRDCNVLGVWGDDRISYSAGQFRSQVWAQTLRTDEGQVYVFSNRYSTATTHRAAALRWSLAGGFDPTYYFDVETPFDGHPFRRVWHLTGSKFLLELYNERTPSSTGPGHQFGIVDMDARSGKWVTGLPARNLITSGAATGGVPCYADGVVYLPITQYGSDAVVYVVDIETGEARPGITLRGVTEVRTLGKLRD